MVRITTWNVNGIRNPFGYQPWRESRSYSTMFDILEADIVVMQELKIQRKDLGDDMVLVDGWDCYFSLPKHKKGYSGVAIYTRQAVCAPIRAEEGLLGVLCPPGSSTPYRALPEDACIGGYPSAAQVADLGVDAASLDAEGRCVVLEFPAFVVFGVYSPANSNGQRDDFRSGFITALDTRIRNLEKLGKRVILTGDLNVSREEMDTARAEEQMQNEGITREDYFASPNRRLFNQLVYNGKIYGERDEGREKPVLWDLCREFHPDREGMYTHWEQKINARPGNFGSRIDYVLCSIEMKDWFAESNIQEGLMGSDHCPVYASTKDVVDCRGEQVHMLDLLSPPGVFKDGKRLRPYSPAKDMRPLSGRLLPEFDKRRSIKDMFTRKPSLSASKSTSNSLAAPQDATAPELSPASNKRATAPVQDSVSTESLSQPAAPASPLGASQKRPAAASPAARPPKRSKASTGGPSGSQSSVKGQQSLMGFFTPKAYGNNSPKQPAKQPANPLSTAAEPPIPDASPSSTQDAAEASVANASPSSTQDAAEALIANTSPSSTPTSSMPTSSVFIDPQATKELWTMLFSKKPPPRCESHNEPCISFKTKKAGMNAGRQFWTCSRPIGPTGQKESGTQWRCGTFIWASDWNGPAAER
ncbi:DNA lyase-like protein [Massariosphaeria phaeospora]|uniref:DNA-(apurinic or apyrimidinic site) endonuclease 2 n=1 Tax=Massariosphaeria phaeospora TaxID=100035 RepID=A0A7C8M1K0_9PLEO|nr:DNA lyase-like protein [Massariosphaeria phaeospora]